MINHYSLTIMVINHCWFRECENIKTRGTETCALFCALCHPANNTSSYFVLRIAMSIYNRFPLLVDCNYNFQSSASPYLTMMN